MTLARVASVPVVAFVVLVGVWLAGGVLTNDFELSMGLVAVWFVVAGATALLIGWRYRWLRVPVIGTYLLTAAVIGGFLLITTARDKTVNETVVTSGVVARGTFVSGAHHTEGNAALARGGRVLTLTRFETSPGPDVRVYLTAARVGSNGSAGEYVDLGGLKGNRGNQQYDIPAGVQIDKYRNVVIWCRAFSVNFGEAALR